MNPDTAPAIPGPQNGPGVPIDSTIAPMPWIWRLGLLAVVVGLTAGAYAVQAEFGPRLQAAIRASQAFIPQGFWLAYHNNRAEMLPLYEAEAAAIQRRDPDGARAACGERAELMARIMLSELVRRGVFKPAGTAWPATSSPGASVVF